MPVASFLAVVFVVPSSGDASPVLIRQGAALALEKL